MSRDRATISTPALQATSTFPVHDGTTRSVMSEGMRSGLVAATGVALAFLAGDTLRAEPFSTPAALGMGLGHLLGITTMRESPVVAALGYSIVHYAAFITVATAFALLARRARRDSTVLAGALLVTFVAELAFVGLLAILRHTTYTGSVTWPQLALGNLLGWALLGWTTWRMHPEIGPELTAAMHGTGAWPAR